MEVIWSPKAKNNLLETLEYWEIRNGSPEYSDKITEALRVLLNDIATNPYFIGRYSKTLNLYVRDILKGRFFIYFSINEALGVIEIEHFRSVKQKPLI